uniref:No apical meristem-associated C-terminal domain-containing protein n=1 Tax=Tanacetum cinerariifolium TaxID=118510 RepID=A0A6L2LQT0_TANCI|nr:hypothetical protein [Tanacetum cinerariifolium]
MFYQNCPFNPPYNNQKAFYNSPTELYRPTMESSTSSLPNQPYSPINPINLDMNFDDLMFSQEYNYSQNYSMGHGSGQGSASGSAQGLAPFHDDEDDSPVEEVSPVKPNKPSRRAAKAKKDEPKEVKEMPKEWTVEEEIALCQGTLKMKPVQQEVITRSLANWKNRVRPRTGAFCAIIKNIEANHESGINDLDVYQKACAEYKMMYKGDFTLEHCYNILKDHPGWKNVEMPNFYQSQGRKKSKTSETTSGSASGGLNLNEEADKAVKETQEFRPMGRDRAKAKKKAAGSSRGGASSDLVADKRGSRVEARRIRVGSWNVGSLTGKLLELDDVLERHRTGSQTARNGIGIIVKACLKDKVVHVDRCSNRIISLTLVIEGETVNVISTYAPQVGLGGDLNGHIGEATEGYPGVHGGFGYGVRSVEGRANLDFATAHDLAVVNSYFKKRDHLITFQSGGRCTQIDCLREVSAVPRILWKNLKGDATEEFRSRFVEGVSTQIDVISASDADTMWNTLASIIKDVADSLGVAIGSSKTHTTRRESWWLCEKVQSKVAEKQARFRELLTCREGNQEERLRAQEKYKEAKKEGKKAVAQAKEKAYEDLYKKMDSKEGANNIFRIAKAKEKRRRDLRDLCVIKDEGGRTITDDEEIKKRWGNTFHPSSKREIQRDAKKLLPPAYAAVRLLLLED